MHQHRIERIQEEIKNTVSAFLLFEAFNHHVTRITVTKVIVTRDLGEARVYYQNHDLKQNPEVQKALGDIRGAVRKYLSSHLSFKSLPKIEFFYDETETEVDRVNRLFSQI